MGLGARPPNVSPLNALRPTIMSAAVGFAAVVFSSAFWNALAAVQMTVDGCLLSPVCTLGAYFFIAVWYSFSDAVCVESMPFESMYRKEYTAAMACLMFRSF